MKPFPYQTECVRSAESFGGRTLFSCSMGLGKSAMSLWYAKRNRTFPLVVVCPVSTKWQWQAEIVKVLKRRSTICEGTKPQPLSDRIVIINYDILGNWVEQLKRLRPQLVILDECQYIANPKAKRTRAVLRLCRSVPHVLALSGTPLVNRPIELFPTLNLLRPDVFKSRFHFGIQFCAGRKGHWGWEFKGATHTDQLNQLLNETCMVRRKKEDVLKDLPSKIHQVIPVALSDVQEYEAAEVDYLGWLAEKDPEAVRRALRAEAVTRTGGLLRLASRLKCKASVDWLNDWLEATDEKMIIFAVHRKMIEALQRRIRFPHVTVDGSVVGKQRQQAVDSFQNDPRVRVFLGNLQAAGTGLNLTAASAVSFIELPWHPGAVAQGIDRAHRIGQTRCVNVYYLVAKGTLEERRAAIIRKKQDVISAVLDGKNVVDLLPVFDEFLKGLK